MYIREAHPQDGRLRPDRQVKVQQPRTLDERVEVASSCVLGLKLDMPTLIDDMKNSTDGAYCGWPDRLFLVGQDGKLAWKSGLGPRGFKPEQLERELAKLPVPTEEPGKE